MVPTAVSAKIMDRRVFDEKYPIDANTTNRKAMIKPG